MTSDEIGPLSIFHAYGGEAALAAGVDAGVRSGRGGAAGTSLRLHELRYGWLVSGDGGEAVDEVMLAKPVEGMRVLMTHGGDAVTAAVRAFFGEAGVAERFFAAAESLEKKEDAILAIDALHDPLASGCITEAQAAAVLEWRAGGAEPPPGLLATHRVVLAGAPNAGKSSLLNRLSGYDRAFVHAEAGATRDVVDELVGVGGYAVWLGDLPGFASRFAGNGVEGEARRRAEERLRLCEAVWFVADGSRPWEGETALAAASVASAASILEGSSSSGSPAVVVVVNKGDLPSAWDGEPWREVFPGARGVRVCSLPDGDAGVVLAQIADEMWGRGG